MTAIDPDIIIVPRVNNRELQRQLHARAIEGAIKKMTPQPNFEDDPKWNGPDKIPPSECWLSVGPGAIEGRVYPTLCAPRKEGEELTELGGNDDVIIRARMKAGFDTAEEAIEFASKLMTAVAVYDATHGFVWPHRPDPVPRQLTGPEIKAQELRNKRAEKRQANYDKSIGRGK